MVDNVLAFILFDQWWCGGYKNIQFLKNRNFIRSIAAFLKRSTRLKGKIKYGVTKKIFNIIRSKGKILKTSRIFPPRNESFILIFIILPSRQLAPGYVLAIDRRLLATPVQNSTRVYGK